MAEDLTGHKKVEILLITSAGAAFDAAAVSWIAINSRGRSLLRSGEAQSFCFFCGMVGFKRSYDWGGE